jgi:hypothetical protein
MHIIVSQRGRSTGSHSWMLSKKKEQRANIFLAFFSFSFSFSFSMRVRFETSTSVEY